MLQNFKTSCTVVSILYNNFLTSTEYYHHQKAHLNVNYVVWLKAVTIISELIKDLNSKNVTF